MSPLHPLLGATPKPDPPEHPLGAQRRKGARGCGLEGARGRPRARCAAGWRLASGAERRHSRGVSRPPPPRPLLGFGSRCSTDGDSAPGPWPRPRALREPPALVTEPTSCVVVTLRASGHLPELSLEGAVAAVTITVRWEREEAACTPVACCARSCGPARRALPCAAHRPAGETRSRRGARPPTPARRAGSGPPAEAPHVDASASSREQRTSQTCKSKPPPPGSLPGVALQLLPLK